MNIPHSNMFSQTSLQDYLDCAYRFELAHLKQVRCPVPEAEPIADWEERARRGREFHWMAQQFIVGVPLEVLEPSGDDELSAWWTRFKRDGMRGLPAKRYAEVSLSVPVMGVRLIAKIDLLAIEPGKRVVIVDYKTHKKQTPKTLKTRLQTRVYRYVVARAGAAFSDGIPVRPEHIEMRYWFAADSKPSVTLDYSQAEYEADERYLTALLEEVMSRSDFPKTDDVSRCQFCTYRSLCDRGQQGGAIEAQETDDFVLPAAIDITEFEF